MDIFDQDSYVIVFESNDDEMSDYNGCFCMVIERLEDSAFGRMAFTVEFSDGETIHAFAEELIIDQTEAFS
jgi:hypothetical protein